MFLVSSALRGPLPEGTFSERVPVLAQYAGGFLAAALMGGFIVLVLWGVRRFRSTPYETPRRDLALAILLMTIVTFRPAQAQAQAQAQVWPDATAGCRSAEHAAQGVSGVVSADRMRRYAP